MAARAAARTLARVQSPTPPAARIDTDEKLPTSAELKAFHELLELTQTLQREPTAQEAFPIIRHLSRRLRGRTGVGTRAEADAQGSTVVRAASVQRVMRRLIVRCGRYFRDDERTKALRAQLGDLALRAARDLVTRGGPYDCDPKLHRSKVHAAVELLRVCGLSAEQGGGKGEQPPNEVLGRKLSPEEEQILDAAKRLDYERQMRDRMGSGAARAANRLPAESAN